MKYKDDFFKMEIIEGFAVESEMKRVWAAQMKVLSEIIRICDKYNITYYADYGTLLGAVRHKGFVPWDDDIDICLKRADYMKLLHVLSKELPAFYSVNSCYTNVNHRQPFSSLGNFAMYPVPEHIKKQFYDCPYVVGVDIYPLDYMPYDDDMAQLQQSMYEIVYNVACQLDEIRERGDIQKYINNIEQMCNITLQDNDLLRNQLMKLYDNIASIYTEEESDRLTQFLRMAQMKEGTFYYMKEWYDSTIKMKFMDMEINVPCGYHEILTTLYGDYMNPVILTSAHEYPFYKRQKLYNTRETLV